VKDLDSSTSARSYLRWRHLKEEEEEKVRRRGRVEEEVMSGKSFG